MLPINVQVNRAINEQVLKNWEKLKPIVEAVLGGQQNIPLGGHRDYSNHCEDEKVNPGNCQEILKFLAQCGQNTVLEGHIANTSTTATYQSKITQSEIGSVCGELILLRLTTVIIM